MWAVGFRYIVYRTTKTRKILSWLENYFLMDDGLVPSDGAELLGKRDGVGRDDAEEKMV